MTTKKKFVPRFDVIKIAKSKEQILEKGTVFVISEKDTNETIEYELNFKNIADEVIHAIETNSNFKFIKLEKPINGCSDAFKLDDDAPDNEPRDLFCTDIIMDISSLNHSLECFDGLKNITKVQNEAIKYAICNAFHMGKRCGQLEISTYEKDLVQKLKMEAGKNKNNPKYWANFLEKEYKKQPTNMSDKQKKSNCYYAADSEYEKLENRESRYPHCYWRRWWKKYYPQRFKGKKIIET
ncbi:MAG: hypothetical protein PHH77_09950 [Victivallaceae bacterium]|nr:hypothetical protein [Victivallaceae bacterium]